MIIKNVVARFIGQSRILYQDLDDDDLEEEDEEIGALYLT